MVKPNVEQHQDDKTPSERFEDLTDKLSRVPKKEVDMLREEQEREKEQAE